MLRVPTYIAHSEIHGIGLFASEDIMEGAVIWEFTPGIDIKISPSALQTLCKVAREQLENFCYINFAGELVLCADNARFMNHSDQPNTKNIDFTEIQEGITLAIRKILAGEEITTNYNEFDPTDLEEWFKNHH